MDFVEKVKKAETYLKTDTKLSVERAEKARRLCYEIKNTIKRARESLCLYPAEWEGISAESHRQFCVEIIGEINKNNNDLDMLSEKLNIILRVYNIYKSENGNENTLPSDIL